MANSDADQLHREMSLSKMGILNFDSNQLYMFSRAPDMLHRMTILVAKMMHDGCFDAHSVVNEELVYDFKKDKRFSLLHSANPNVNSEEYRKQHALYITMLEQFNREGYNLKMEMLYLKLIQQENLLALNHLLICVLDIMIKILKC